jgi:hypothetical protein
MAEVDRGTPFHAKGRRMATDWHREARPFAHALVEHGVSWEEATRAARTIIWEERRRSQRYPCTVAIPLAGQRRAITADVDPVSGALTLLDLGDGTTGD